MLFKQSGEKDKFLHTIKKGAKFMRLVLNNVSKQYNQFKVLNKISLTLQSGGVYGLVGPNGAGKTTLIKLLTTLEEPTSGSILLNNEDIVKQPSLVRNSLGYLPQDVHLYPYLTSVEYLTYFGGIKGINKHQLKHHVNELIHMFNLQPYVKKKLGTYSGGMKQRVALACALLGNPRIIILDEPSVGLDPEERVNLRNLFEVLSQTRILILSTHIISDIELTAQNIIVLQNGQVKYSGDKRAFVANTVDMEEAYLKMIGRDNRRVVSM